MVDFTHLNWEWDRVYELPISTGMSKEGELEIRRALSKTYRLSLPKDFFEQKTEVSISKRISKYLNDMGKATTPAYISYIGNLASENAVLRDFTARFRFVQRIDWKAGDYGDDNSCFWGEKRQAIPLIHHYGGFAIQFLNKAGQGTGRCLGARLGDGVIVVFNSYGRLTDDDTLGPGESSASRGRQDAKLIIVAQVLSKFFSTRYRGISLYNLGKDSGTMYINSARGFVIGDDVLTQYLSSYDLEWDESILPKCNCCGRFSDESELVEPPTKLKSRGSYAPGYKMCKNCLAERMGTCSQCGESYFIEDGIGNAQGLYLCSKKCATESGLRSCCNCGSWALPSNLILTGNRNLWYCWGCASRYVQTCDKCWKLTPTRILSRVVATLPSGKRIDQLHCPKCCGKEDSEDADPKAVKKKKLEKRFILGG